ncbi:MAG: hypothetical protein WC683_17430 [bacterium]
MPFNDITGAGVVSGVASEDNSTLTQTYDNSVNPTFAGDGDANVNLSFGSEAPDTFVLGNPAELAASMQLANDALESNLSASRSVFDLAAAEHKGAQELASRSTATASEQWVRSIVAVGIVAALVLGVYWYTRRGKA